MACTCESSVKLTFSVGIIIICCSLYFYTWTFKQNNIEVVLKIWLFFSFYDGGPIIEYLNGTHFHLMLQYRTPLLQRIWQLILKKTFNTHYKKIKFCLTHWTSKLFEHPQFWSLKNSDLVGVSNIIWWEMYQP